MGKRRVMRYESRCLGDVLLVFAQRNDRTATAETKKNSFRRVSGYSDTKEYRRTFIHSSVSELRERGAKEEAKEGKAASGCSECSRKKKGKERTAMIWLVYPSSTDKKEW